MSRGKTNNDFVFPFIGNAKLAQKLANVSRSDQKLEPIEGQEILEVRISEDGDLLPGGGPGTVFAIFGADGEYMVNNKTMKWEDVA